jgi:hypothetical protein
LKIYDKDCLQDFKSNEFFHYFSKFERMINKTLEYAHNEELQWTFITGLNEKTFNLYFNSMFVSGRILKAYGRYIKELGVNHSGNIYAVMYYKLCR